MPDETPIYELTLLLSTDAEEDARARILSEVEAAIQRGGGSVLNKSAWGTRSLAYRIDRRDDAEFHLLEMTAPANLLTELSHNLHIADGVLRFRIIKAVAGGRGKPSGEPAAAAARGSAEGQSG
ncbi:MAG TPA: 30S ribosomal protein S6 [Solirubrobacteraceae bacterium]|jgi:small subunit ribosomal protein S6